MNKFSLVLLWCLSLCVTSAQDSSSRIADIKISAVYSSWVDPLLDPKKAKPDLTIARLDLWLYIENVSDTVVRVATVMNNNSWNCNASKVSLRIALGKTPNPLDKEIIEGEVKLGISELRPGEITLIKTNCDVRLESLKRVEVTYVVDPRYGERYRIWSGTLNTIATELK